MYKYTKSIDEIETINIVVYLAPIFYETSEILSSIEFDKNSRKWKTDINPERVINGPLSRLGEELESPIKEEYDRFVDDCKDLIETMNFIIIDSYRSDDSKKSEYVLMFGLENNIYGRLVIDFRISEHTLEEYNFPEELKDEALKYLTTEGILDGSATKAGIDFKVDRVTVGSVKNDTWNRALNCLYARLKTLKKKILNRISEQNSRKLNLDAKND